MKRFSIQIMTIALLSFILCASALAAQFSAELIDSKGDKKVHGKIYVKDHQYRLEVPEAEEKVIVLVDEKTGKTKVLVPSKKIFLEFKNTDMKSLMNNPFQTFVYSKKHYDSKDTGKETINGYECRKTLLSTQGQDLMTAWGSTKLGFLVKIVNHGAKDMFVELKNIMEGPVDNTHFKVPEGYKKMDRMPVPPPAWAKDIPKASYMEPPFEKSISASEIVRVKIIPGYSLKVKGSNKSDQKGAFTSVAFKDKQPIKDPSFSTFNLPPKSGGITVTHKEKPGEADEVIIRVRKGAIFVTTELIEAPIGMILVKNYVKKMSGKELYPDPKKKFLLRLTDNEKDGAATRGDMTIYEGKAQHKKELEKIKFNLKNGETRVWEYPKEKQIGTVSLDMWEGGVNTRLEQPEKAGTTPEAWGKVPTSTKDSIKVQSKVPERAMAKAKTTETQKKFAQTTGAASNTAKPATVIGKGSAILILDASGSMWGQIKGKSKIEIAREVIGDLLQNWDTSMPLGLSAYGHRRKGDCNDIETIIPAGQADPKSIIKAIQAINPKGKTPLSEAVRRAAKELRYSEERATVVLISDGVETCNVDPCAIGAELAMSGVDFTAHVIGFDVKDVDQVGLRCLAEKTGGLFLAAANADELREALSKTVEKTKEAPAPLVEEPGEATVTCPAEVPAGSGFKAHWEGPDSRNDYITIVTQNAPEGSFLNYTYTSKGNPVTIYAPEKTGNYEVRYVFGHKSKTLAKASIKVTPVEASLTCPQKTGAGSSFEIDWTGPDNRSDYITIVPAGAGDKEHADYVYTNRGTPAKLRASDKTGEYEVRYIMGQSGTVLARAKITVTAVGATVKTQESISAGAKFKIDWTGPDTSGDYISLAAKGSGDKEYLTYTYTNRGNPATLRASDETGEYEIRYVMGQSGKVLARAKITVTAVGATVKTQESISAGAEFKIDWTGPDTSGDYISLAAKGSGDKEYITYTYTNRGNPATLRTTDKPGGYEIRYILSQSGKVLARTQITVTPVSANLEVPASMPAGSKFKINWTGPDTKGDYISLAAKGSGDNKYITYTYTSRGNPATLRAPDKLGEYEIRYILSQSKTVLARSTVTLTPVSAKVEAPSSVAAGAKFNVTWEGPNYQGDYIVIALAGSKDKDYKAYSYTSRGNPAKIKAPAEPGAYEVRYILNQSKIALARTPLTVSP